MDRSFVYEPLGSWVQDWAGRLKHWMVEREGRTYVSEKSLDKDASAGI